MTASIKNFDYVQRIARSARVPWAVATKSGLAGLM
jgi:hypothetical protein